MDNYIYYIIYAITIIILLSVSIITIILSNKKINNVIDSTSKTIQNIKKSIPSLNGSDRLNYTNELLSFIDNAINVEIINARRFELLLGTKNKNLDVENVISDVSTKVFNSIKPEIFTDPDLIVTDKYLMSYIQKRTTVTYISYLNENAANEE